MNISFEYPQITSLQPLADPTTMRMDAVKSFNQAYGRGKRSQLLARILHKNNHLQSLSKQPIASSHPTGRVVTVSIDKIKGSLGRTEDFDASFNPLQEGSRSRWVSILSALCAGKVLPPVELVQVGDAYYVQDGHHRISVARSLDQEAIEAQIMN